MLKIANGSIFGICVVVLCGPSSQGEMSKGKVLTQLESP